MFELTEGPQRQEAEEAGRVIHVEDIDGTPGYYLDGDVQKPITIKIVGTYSRTYRTKMRQQRNQVLRQLEAPSGETIDQQQTELVAACILGWEGFAKNGQPFPHTTENAIALLKALPWVQRQLEIAMGNHRGFSTRSSSA